jgi:hypothetical protein
MRDALRCVLSEARDTRGQELFADKDAVSGSGGGRCGATPTSTGSFEELVEAAAGA